MPQMGESIAEGTITRWLKQVGERVERDEPLFEISTDKVDAEIPSPAAGTLQEIKYKEGDTVEVNLVVAVIGDGAGASAETSAQPQAAAIAPPTAATGPTSAPAAQAAVASAPPPVAASSAPAASLPQQQQAAPSPLPQIEEVAGRGYDYDRPGAVAQGEALIEGGDGSAAASASQPSNGEASAEELRRTKSSPLVRNIAKEHNIDIARLEGTGMSGRVTKNDILSFIESGAQATPQTQPTQSAATTTAPTSAPPQPQALQLPPTQPAPPVQPAVGDRVEPMSVMRRKIAEHMIMSQNVSAHVTTVYEIDMTRVARLRDRHKAAFLQQTGTKLTFMPFIFQAVLNGIRKFPVFNAQVSGEQVIYKQDINLGLAVALDWGLIVPVIKRADDLSIAGLARAANDLADRARAKQLKPDEVAGGTFTITNPRRLRRPLRDADHQSAAGRHSRRRCD